MNGFRAPSKPSGKDRIRDLEQQINNLATAVRLMQMAISKTAESVSAQANDVLTMKALTHDLDYRTNAMVELYSRDFASVDEFRAELNAKADENRLRDYNAASEVDDTQKGLVPTEVVEDDSTIVITSTTVDPSKGIFRSKLQLNQIGVPALSTALVGRRVGEKVEVLINGDTHLVEVLAIRKVLPKVAVEVTATPNV